MKTIKKMKFRSGNDQAYGLTCCNCGTAYQESVREHGWAIGNGTEDGDCVVCTCGGRCAYLVLDDEE